MWVFVSCYYGGYGDGDSLQFSVSQDVYGAGIAALVRDSYSLVEGKADKARKHKKSIEKQ